MDTPFHSIFHRLLEERDCHVWFDDVAHYKAVDPATGKIGHMTLIQYSILDDDGYAVTAADYFKYENCQNHYPIDERAGLFFLNEDVRHDFKLDFLERSNRTKCY